MRSNTFFKISNCHYRKINLLILSTVFVTFISFYGCSSPQVKTQSYAKLTNVKVFEEEFSVVWKATGIAISEYKLEKKSQESGKVETDWIYSTSNDKYIEYQVNGFPRKRYLQTRYKYIITLAKQIGGVKVTVDTIEEVETLKSDGSSDTWKSVSEPDTARQNDMLKAIELKILDTISR